MRFVLYADSRLPVHLAKCVITSFWDYPKVGNVTSYIEMCVSKGNSLILLTPEEVAPESNISFYNDLEACRALISEFEPLSSPTTQGEHIQRIGSNLIEVIPRYASVADNASPPRYSDLVAKKITFGDDAPPGKAWGTWINYNQKTDFPINGYASTGVTIDCEIDGVLIDNFVFFIFLPIGYRTSERDYEVIPLLETKKGLAESAQETNGYDPILESNVTKKFPIFPAWRNVFYHRKFLRNRKPIPIKFGIHLTIRLTAISEALASRMSSQSYFIGILFALFSGLFLNSIFSYLGAETSNTIVQNWIIGLGLVGLIGTIVSGVFGFLALTSSRISEHKLGKWLRGQRSSKTDFEDRNNK